MVLVWLAKGDTFAQLGAHFAVSTDTAWRYTREGMELLAAHAPDLHQALQEAGEERRLLLDGTLIDTAFAVLKQWRILDKVRISPNRITDLLHAILAIIQKRSSLAGE